MRFTCTALSLAVVSLVAALAVSGCEPEDEEAASAPAETSAPDTTAPEEKPAPTTPAPPDTVTSPGTPHVPEARATLAPTQGNQAAGQLTLIAEDAGGVRVIGAIQGLDAGSEHAIHIHEKGDCSAPDASSAGAHFNPGEEPHGDPEGTAHHAGDMPNITADAQGNAMVSVHIPGIGLGGDGPGDAMGKALVVHKEADDYRTQPAGDSGARIACGVIEANAPATDAAPAPGAADDTAPDAAPPPGAPDDTAPDAAPAPDADPAATEAPPQQ